MKKFLSSIICILLIATIILTSYASAEDDNVIASYLNVYDVVDVGKKNAVPIYDLSKSYSKYAKTNTAYVTHNYDSGYRDGEVIEAVVFRTNGFYDLYKLKYKESTKTWTKVGESSERYNPSKAVFVLDNNKTMYRFDDGEVWSAPNDQQLFKFIESNKDKDYAASNKFAINGTVGISIDIGQNNFLKMKDTSNESASVIENIKQLYEVKYTQPSGFFGGLRKVTDAENTGLIVGRGGFTNDVNIGEKNEEFRNKLKSRYPNDTELMKALGFIKEVQNVADKINGSGSVSDKNKATDELSDIMSKNGIIDSKSGAITDAVKTSTNSWKGIMPEPKVVDGYTWKKTSNGSWTLVDKTGEVFNYNGWILQRDNSSDKYNLYYMKGITYAPNYEKEWNENQVIAWTDASGYGYLYDKKVEVSSLEDFSSEQLGQIVNCSMKGITPGVAEEVIKDTGSIAASIEQKPVGSTVTDTVISNTPFAQEKPTESTTTQSAMEIAGAKNIDADGKEIQTDGKGATLTTNYDTSRIKLQYQQTQHTEVHGYYAGDTYVREIKYIPDTKFDIDWPQNFKIVNGNLKSKSHYIPTAEEVKEVIASMYANAPNGAKNAVSESFSAMNREANESYNQYLPVDLRRMFGGDFYDIDMVVDPAAIVAANLDCLVYDAGTINWNTTDPVNGWILNESNQYIASNELMNMLILKAFGEYQYFSCYTVDKSQAEGVINLYITRSVQEQYSDYKDSMFNLGIATKDKIVTFNDILKFIYKLDEKYAPLRNEKINMTGLVESDFSNAGILSIEDKDLKDAIYYLVKQGYFTVDEVSDKYGKPMSEDLIIYITKKIYEVVNRNVNINTRISK